MIASTRGWRDQPTRPTYKGCYPPQFVHVDDLLTRTRCFKCGELGHLARNCSQKREDDPALFSGDKETATESETFFSGMTLGDLNVETVLVEQEEFFYTTQTLTSLVILTIRPFLPSRKSCFCTTQTSTRRMELSCSTQTLRR